MSVSSDLSVLSDLRRQGDLTEEEYVAARRYVLEHGTLEVGKDATMPDPKLSGARESWSDIRAFLAAQLVTNWRRVLTITALTLAGCVITGWALLWWIENGRAIQGMGKINVLGAAGWTVILLACCGLLVGYNMRILKAVSIPLFLFLLLSPLWNDMPVQSDGPKFAVLYSRTVTAAEYGDDWPFPAFSYGVLRCEHMTKNNVMRSLVTVQLAQRVFGLNGAAMGWGGYRDARSQMAKHPEWETYQLGATSRMITEALTNCDRLPGD